MNERCRYKFSTFSSSGDQMSVACGDFCFRKDQRAAAAQQGPCSRLSPGRGWQRKAKAVGFGQGLQHVVTAVRGERQLQS